MPRCRYNVFDCNKFIINQIILGQVLDMSVPRKSYRFLHGCNPWLKDSVLVMLSLPLALTCGSCTVTCHPAAQTNSPMTPAVAMNELTLQFQIFEIHNSHLKVNEMNYF